MKSCFSLHPKFSNETMYHDLGGVNIAVLGKLYFFVITSCKKRNAGFLKTPNKKFLIMPILSQVSYRAEYSTVVGHHPQM